MQRMMQTALIVLVIAIGLTAGSLAWRVTSAPRTARGQETTDPAVGYAFYQALDEVMESGDRSALDRVVSSGFIDHNGDRARSTGDLANDLAALGTSFPDMRIQVLDIQTAAGTLVASIAPVRSSGTAVEGMHFAAGSGVSGSEVLQIQHGKVSARWASAIPGVQLSTFADAAFAFAPISSSSIKLEEIDLPEGGRFEWTSRGDRAVLVEAGAIQLDIRWIGSEGEQMHTSQMAAAGQALSSPAGENVTVRTESGASARILVLTLQKSTPTNPSSIELGPGATLTLLWSSYLPFDPNGTWHLSFGRVALSAGSMGLLSGDARSTVLLANTNGSSRLSIDGGKIATLDQAAIPASPETIALLDAGNAALVEEAESMEIANAGAEPSVMWLIGVRVDAPPTTPETHSGTPVMAIPRGAGFKSG
jgi:hypothetical protein